MPDNPKRVLLVDDSALNRKLLEEALLGKGFAVTIAEDGQQGLMLMTQEMPDLIVMDVVMPNMNGWEATRHMRSVAATKAVPIILMTSKNTPHDMLAAFEAGADDFINKPIDLPELFEMIQKLLEKASAPAAAPAAAPAPNKEKANPAS